MVHVLSGVIVRTTTDNERAVSAPPQRTGRFAAGALLIALPRTYVPAGTLLIALPRTYVPAGTLLIALTRTYVPAGTVRLGYEFLRSSAQPPICVGSAALGQCADSGLET